tara:strand:- start:1040 stop:1168 length:129 start_codon:yes stop_codon:yes gene_type:complete
MLNGELKSRDVDSTKKPELVFERERVSSNSMGVAVSSNCALS